MNPRQRGGGPEPVPGPRAPRALAHEWWLLVVLAGWFALGNAGAADRPVLDLGGEWEFRRDPKDVGRSEHWFARGVPFERSIRVPGSWNAQGIAFATDAELHAYEEERLQEQKSLNQLGILGGQRESERLFSVYPGPGWYRRAVTIPADWAGKTPWLRFAGVHREAQVWIDGRPAAEHRSYLVPFRVDLSPFAKPGDTVSVVVRVDARRHRDVDPLMGCLDTLDFLYVTWGGIHRPVTLEATAPTRLDDVFVVPRPADRSAEIRVEIGGDSAAALAVEATLTDADGEAAGSARGDLAAGESRATFKVTIPSPRLWSPRSPHLYSARVRLTAGGRDVDARTVRFGLREFAVEGGRFLLNGKPIFLRGYGDDCIFPNTVCPPAGKEEFRRRLQTAREYGFNYVRHHSWTPPTEYLEAADELGMMLQPEFPFAYGWDLPKTPAARQAALEQWAASIRQHRNHPSVVVWCMGNELYNSFEFAPEMYRTAKSLDPTRPVIDSDGCNLSHQDRATLDFLVVQFGEGHSIGFQDRKYELPAGLPKPVIAHEMGYFVTLPDLRQLDLFGTGVRPYWLYQARDLAVRHGVTAQYPDWLAASYRLQAASLKCNLEAARRSRLSGTSVWLFQDYPNCAEGVVDMFLRPKGVGAEAFRRFNAPTVLLLDSERRNWRAGESARFSLLASRFEDAPSDAAVVRWRLSLGSETLASGVREGLTVRADGVQELLAATAAIPARSEAARLRLAVELEDANGRIENDWDWWAFPTSRVAQGTAKLRVQDAPAVSALYPWAGQQTAELEPSTADLLVTSRLTPRVLEYLAAGGRVFLLEPEPAFAVEKTNFRLSSWDGGGPSGTLLDPRSPALRSMPTEGWCDLQFYPLIQGSRTILLDAPGMEPGIPPLVRCIDRPTRLANRAYLFEVGVGRGRLLVSGFNFVGALGAGDPAATFFIDQLIRYALGPDFVPATALPAEQLRSKITP